VTDDQITIRDTRGASLVLERGDDGQVFAWIAPPGGNDGHSVGLDANALAQIAAFLGFATKPVVDFDGESVWLDPHNQVQWVPVGHGVPEGWRRLYVASTTDGGT
jgi:hypothetical protein